MLPGDKCRTFAIDGLSEIRDSRNMLLMEKFITAMTYTNRSGEGTGNEVLPPNVYTQTQGVHHGDSFFPHRNIPSADSCPNCNRYVHSQPGGNISHVQICTAEVEFADGVVATIPWFRTICNQCRSAVELPWNVWSENVAHLLGDYISNPSKESLADLLGAFNINPCQVVS